jgi:hypothetical protein
VTKEAVVARQAKVLDQLPPIPGEQRVVYTPVAQMPPDWWAEALIPLDDVPASALRDVWGDPLWEKSGGKVGTEHHMGQAKWAEMVAWEMLDDETKKQVILSKLDQRIMRKEFKIGFLKHTSQAMPNSRSAAIDS